jgi:hypothetical protein
MLSTAGFQLQKQQALRAENWQYSSALTLRPLRLNGRAVTGPDSVAGFGNPRHTCTNIGLPKSGRKPCKQSSTGCTIQTLGIKHMRHMNSSVALRTVIPLQNYMDMPMHCTRVQCLVSCQHALLAIATLDNNSTPEHSVSCSPVYESCSNMHLQNLLAAAGPVYR